MTRLNERWVEPAQIAVAVSSNAITLSPGLESRYLVVDVDDDIDTITINAPDGVVDFCVLFQFAGSYDVSGFPSTVKWGVGSNVPTFSGTSGQEILVMLQYWGSTNGYRADASAAFTPTAES